MPYNTVIPEYFRNDGILITQRRKKIIFRNWGALNWQIRLFRCLRKHLKRLQRGTKKYQPNENILVHITANLHVLIPR